MAQTGFSLGQLMAFIFGMQIYIFQLSSTRFQVFQTFGKLKAVTKERERDSKVKKNKDPQACNNFASNKADV